jgi:hypothetical protein
MITVTSIGSPAEGRHRVEHIENGTDRRASRHGIIMFSSRAAFTETLGVGGGCFPPAVPRLSAIAGRARRSTSDLIGREGISSHATMELDTTRSMGIRTCRDQPLRDERIVPDITLSLA